MRHLRTAVLALAVLWASEAAAYEATLESQLRRPSNVTFREGLLEDRSFKYADDHFLTVLSYRPRYPLRVLARLASTGYALSVGSVSTSDFYLDQEAQIRLPIAPWLLGQFDFLQSEDYDSRYLKAIGEATILVPGMGHESVADPLQLTTNTPPAWGLFLGGSVELNAFKEFDDAGGHVGYRNKVFGARLDVLFPAAFYNAKNRSGGKLDGMPLAFQAQVEAAFGDDGPFASAWLGHQPRVGGRFPAVQLDHGSLEKSRGGFEVIVPFDRRVVVDLDVMGELTGKLRHFDATAPARSDRFRREAGQVWLDTNVYLGDLERPKDATGVGPELSSRDAVVPRDVLARTTPANWASTDVIELGLFAQYLNELAEARGGTVAPTARTRRREAYAYAGYLLTLPSVLEGLALHPAFYCGYVFSRETSREPIDPKKRAEGLLAKVNAAVEYRFRDLADVVVNMTVRLDQPQFGGGNVQVIFRF